MIQPLIKNDNYNGKFVAFKNFDDHCIVGEGITPQQDMDLIKQRLRIAEQDYKEYDK
jgi:hypothetical protein